MTGPLLAARAAVAALAAEPLTLLGVSGGADSLALAMAASTLPGRFGAVIVDHSLQPGSAQVAQQAAETCRALGLDPVLVEKVETSSDEASARTARYAVFDRALHATGAPRLLLAHTRDDQAEQVLLGLLRGSGTRSLAGMPRQRGPYARPLLELSRQDTEAICGQAGLEFWVDPSNADTSYRRNQVRHVVLPFLSGQLGAHVPEALARTAQLAAADADALDSWARRAYAEHGTRLRELRTLPVAVASRVLRRAAVEAGGVNIGHERTGALCALGGIGREPSKSAGPVQLEGGISAWRRNAVIVFTGTGSPPAP